MEMYRIKATKLEGPMNYVRYNGRYILCTKEETKEGVLWSKVDIKRAMEDVGHAFKYCGHGMRREKVED